MIISTVGGVTYNNYSNLSIAAKLPQNRNFPALKTESISLCPKKMKQKAMRISASSIMVEEKEKRNEGVVAAVKKPRLVLKFVWMEKNIGIALNQMIGGGPETVPLSPYYFWPRIDAWEELKFLLESKSWISNKQVVLLLNQATDIINLWQKSGGDFA
ncbi:hypothetical protein ACP275_02G011800 [Erythranthe tilingii]